MKREYGIDILKMVAMIMVIAHHVLQACTIKGVVRPLGIDTEIERLFHVFCYCAVDCFVMATGYIMCRHDFKYIRIFKLWRQVVGYSLLITTIALVLEPSALSGIRDWVMAVFPVLTKKYWFFTEYFALFFTIPFLNKMLNVATRREQLVLFGSGICLLSVLPFIAGKDIFAIHYGYSFLWFVFLYLVGAMLSLNEISGRIPNSVKFAALSVGCMVTAGGDLLGRMLTMKYGCGARFCELSCSYASPSLLLEAIALLLLFSTVKIRNMSIQRFVVFAAPSTFIVYIVHTDEVFKRLVGWAEYFERYARASGLSRVLLATLVGILLFVVIISVDMLRRWTWKRLTKHLI